MKRAFPFILSLLLCGWIPAQIPTSEESPIQVGANQKEPLKVNDSIFQAIGFGNTFLVKTSEGSVIIDTSISFQAQKHKKLLETLNPGPIKYIILTHGHADHTGGVPLWKGPETQVIAQKNFAEFQHYQKRLEGFLGARAAAQFARATSAAPKRDKWPGNRDAEIVATILFDDKYEFELGGVKFICMSTPGETYDHLTVWIPQFKAAFVGDNFYDSFPNMYTLRGTQPRWALDYVDSINKVLDLKPEILLPSHGMPRYGNELITKELTRYRDAILYVHDATVRGMNEGKDVFTLMKEIHLPPELNVGEGYGRLTWSIRGIYEGYVGWFDGDPADMFEVPPSDAYPEMVRLAGGADAVAKRALELIGAGEELKGLHMANMALKADPNHKGALEARVAGLEALIKKSNNFNERNWLNYGMTTAKSKLKN